MTRAHVILTADKHRQVAEVSVHSRQLDLAAVEVSSSAAARRCRARSRSCCARSRSSGRGAATRKGADSPRLAGAAATAERRAEAAGAAAPRVIRSRRSAVKPMTLDEAALEMGARGEGVLVYRDAATERVSVLYRRKDGNLGLIEPEA